MSLLWGVIAVGWGRIDDEFDDWPEILALLDHDDQGQAREAIGLWTLCFSWANRNTRKKGRTPGLLPAGLPRKYYGADGRACAELLAKYELWEPAPDGGWRIVRFEDSLPSDETRAARAEAGRRGAAKRWGKQAATQAGGNLPRADGKEPSARHQPDSNGEASDGLRARVPLPIPIPIPPPPPNAASADHHPTGVRREPDREEGESTGSQCDPDRATEVLLGIRWPPGRGPVASTRPKLLRLVRDCLERGHAPDVVRDEMTRDLTSASSPVGVVVKRLEGLAATEPTSASAQQADVRPRWCGNCDKTTRIRDQPDGRPFRCPECHPLTKEPDA